MCPSGLNASQGALIAWQKSAEGIVSLSDATQRQGTIPVRATSRGRADQGPNGESGK